MLATPAGNEALFNSEQGLDLVGFKALGLHLGHVRRRRF